MEIFGIFERSSNRQEMSTRKETPYKTSDIHNDMVFEPQAAWGGEWTLRKLDAFEKYVRSYLTIMRRFAPKYGWKLFYFDAFAGSGTREKIGENISSQSDESMFPESEIEAITKISNYKGAAERALGVEIEDFGFDYYYFVDKDKTSIDKLKEKLAEVFPGKASKMRFRTGDANAEILKLVDYSQKHPESASLVLLDPFGMQLNWETIQALKTIKHIDLWILVPSGVIINRLLTRKGEILCQERLSKTFGMSIEELEQYFYKEVSIQTLFGEQTRIEKSGDSIGKIAQLYLQRLRTEFKFVIKEPLVLYNSTNCPIFHFVFASHNETGMKIASEIVGRTK